MLGFTRVRTIIQMSDQPSAARISIILPVLNEAARVPGALDTLARQPDEVAEILVVDSGSTDETRQIVASYGERDPRIKLLDASPVDAHWTGKVWGLHCGFRYADTRSDWILCIDADVQAEPQLARSLLAHAQRTGINVFSVATRQRLAGKIDGLLHPAMAAQPPIGTASRPTASVFLRGERYYCEPRRSRRRAPLFAKTSRSCAGSPSVVNK
jgi:glycosyltransferase involved in cell wall biosynthesis